MEKSFQERYNMLNAEQKKAVDTIDGPVMVVAGPGTGKTQILTLRIANILDKTDTGPENILALTFTESGVNAMRKRLASMIGSLAYRVNIYTFHSFANDVIQNNPEDFPSIIGARPITDVEQISHIESIILAEDFEILKPFGDSLYYVRTIRGKISELKREGVTVDDFEQIVLTSQKEFSQIEDRYYESGKHEGRMKGKYKDQEKQIKKNQELLVIYRLYQEILQKNKQYDFDDMIVELLRSLRNNSDLLLRLQEEFQYILVDEHQDTNNAQNKILELLANFHDNPNFFVVGDEKQSIFKFQGASLENFFYFKHLYPQAELVALTQNYRSTQSILDASYSLLSGKVALESNSSEKLKPIDVFEYRNSNQEYVAIAEKIQEIVQDGIPAHEIAVLYRNNAHAFPLASILDKNGVAYTIESDQSIFEDLDIKKLLQIARAVQNPDDNEKVSKLLFTDIFDINPIQATKFVRAASQKRKKLLIDILLDQKEIDEILSKDVKEGARQLFVDLANNLSVWKKKSHNTPVVEMLEILVRESGFLQYIMAGDRPTERVETIGILFDQARALSSDTKTKDVLLQDFLQYIDLLETHEINIKKKSARVREGAVRLMTAHKSKGLEFECVCIVGVNDGVWGNKKRRELLPLLPKVYQLFDTVPSAPGLDTAGGDDDEERRLFYVALTRAKQHVLVSYVNEALDGKELLPSQFIGEIDEHLVCLQDTEDFVRSWPEKQMMLFNERVSLNVSIEEYKEQMKAFVRDKFMSQGLSVSALNNYLKSPWLYFFRSLVRIPSPMNRYLSYGNAVHGALQDFFDVARGETYETKEFLIGVFHKHLNKQKVLERDYEDLRKKGEESLSAWFDEYQGSWNLDTRTEFRVNGVTVSGIEGSEYNIKLTGVLDKLEFIDGSQGLVTVVDYKTGKPKTEGQVKGTTKDSNGEYYRQLVFYKLLLKYFADGKMKMKSGVLEFVEPDDKGNFRRHEFDIPDEDVFKLEDEIRRVSDEILNLDFWDNPITEDDEEHKDLILALRR